MIIDCHGHYTTAPDELGHYRDAQRRELELDPLVAGVKGELQITDDQISHSVEGAQLRLQRERGIDLTLFSPRASWMGHHLGNQSTSKSWTEHCNDLVKRVCDLYPTSFAPVCQLPQSPGAPIDASVAELRRCVEQMDFVGLNLNPDPSGGYWTGPPLADHFWYPLYEAMVDLDVPAMVHVSQACNPHVYTTGSHYLGADTAAFQQLVMSDVFSDFASLRFIIPHGGGAVPYHWGRFRGILQDLDMAPLEELMGDNLYVDTCVYHQAGIDLLTSVVPVANVLFASEMVGAVKGIDASTGHAFDDTRRFVDAADLTDAERTLIYEGNARRVFPRLAVR